MLLVNTPYDDVFKTLVNDCSELLIPVINEIFHEQFEGNEEVVFLPNEHFINQQNGKEQERITDTVFQIIGKESKKYHLECQSTGDSSMLIRMFEYDAQIALDQGELKGSVLTVTFPNSAIFYLRSSKTTHGRMHIKMKTPAGEITYPILVMQMRSYTLDMIFEKKLLFLIPFYIFVHENRFIEYNKNTDKLKNLIKEYEIIKNKLEDLCQKKVINEYTKCCIVDMSNKVLEHIAKNYNHIKEGVQLVMGGKVLDYEAKSILNKGRAEGAEETLKRMIRIKLEKGKTVAQIAEEMEESVEKITELIRLI